MAAAASLTAHITSTTTLMPVITAYEIYLTDQGRSPYTVKAFLSDLRLMASFFTSEAELNIITTEALNKYFEWMQNERAVPCSPKTLARRITTTKSFFRWLNKNGVLLQDPAEKVIQRSVMSPIPEILTDNEIESVILSSDKYRRKTKPDARPYVLLNLLLQTGIKKRECLGIHQNHI
ncbi:MAG: site-specific integrase, partial [Chloroflexota bacterium]